MIDLVHGHETMEGYQLRAWSGIAVDEGVGLIALIEVSDQGGRQVARFEEFLDARVRNSSPDWPFDDEAAARRLQEMALDRARAAIASGGLAELNGHRYDVRDA